MDVQMPGISGLEAAARIRAEERQQGKAPIMIIGMTAHALAGDRERCLAAGMNDYLSKPIAAEILAEKLSRAAKAVAA
jgi:CheY-like chemotaxis protein